MRNENWSDFMEEITPSHKAFWKVTKALKTEGYIPIPHLTKPDNSIALDDAEIAECLADSIEYTALHTTLLIFDISRKKSRTKSPSNSKLKDNLRPVSHSKVQMLVKSFKIKKAPGLDGISKKQSNAFLCLYWAYLRYLRYLTLSYEIAIFLPSGKRRKDARDAHWCVRNSILNRDLELPTIHEDASKRYFDIAGCHPNTLLRSAVDYEPPHSHNFIRRPLNVLTHPPDALTAAIDSLMEVNVTHD
ncbi:hypothetical protein EVAR_52137_1 [Eumeta japonica]|uniref:Uncharacterized protein n=1 Tax=Eumeta variegata TaxID=151549 RepID=A0A4C1XQN2_EUMVA|nr:hypothetical protein EVAR_52137_1 [Eumeta japonica]